MKIHWSQLNHEKYGKISVGMLVFSFFWCMMIYPKILKVVVKMQSVLKPGARNREKVYMNIPFELDFRLYMFNITNPEEIMQGGTPIVQEVGPYRFGEWKKKFDEVDNNEDDSLEFDLKNTYYYKPDKTAPLTGNEVITTVHPILMGAIIKTKQDNPGLLDMVMRGMNLVFENPSSPFLTVKVWDLLYGGIPLKCDHEDFEGQAVCGAFETELAQQIEHLNETHLSFSLFKGGNGSSVGRFKVKRGMEDIQQLNAMMEYNGEAEVDNWDGDECNQFRGTDGLMFAPFKEKKDTIWAFSYGLCRAVGLVYLKKTRYKGIGLKQFTTYFPDLRNHPDQQCFCRDPPDGCPPEGVLDLAPCLGGPLFGTKPHFLEVDPKVQVMVKGLKPDPKKHQLTADFDLFAGNPLHALQRLQINMDLIPVEEYPIMANMPTLYLPMFWLEEGISITGELQFMIRLLHFGQGFNAIAKWVCLLGGLVGSAICGYFIANKPQEEQVRVVAPTSKLTSAGVVKMGI